MVGFGEEKNNDGVAKEEDESGVENDGDEEAEEVGGEASGGVDAGGGPGEEDNGGGSLQTVEQGADLVEPVISPHRRLLFRLDRVHFHSALSDRTAEINQPRSKK